MADKDNKEEVFDVTPADESRTDAYGRSEGDPDPYDNYDEALEAYQERDDVETLDDRRSREAGRSVRETAFVREGNTQGVVTSDDVKGKSDTKKTDDKK
jgi:hypothetical protein